MSSKKGKDGGGEGDRRANEDERVEGSATVAGFVCLLHGKEARFTLWPSDESVQTKTSSKSVCRRCASSHVLPEAVKTPRAPVQANVNQPYPSISGENDVKVDS